MQKINIVIVNNVLINELKLSSMIEKKLKTQKKTDYEQ